MAPSSLQQNSLHLARRESHRGFEWSSLKVAHSASAFCSVCWPKPRLWPEFSRIQVYLNSLDFPGDSVVKNPPANAEVAREMGSIPASERFPVVGNSNPLQYSCLENPMDRGAWRATVHGVTKSWAWLSNWAGGGAQIQGASKWRLAACSGGRGNRFWCHRYFPGMYLRHRIGKVSLCWFLSPS